MEKKAAIPKLRNIVPFHYQGVAGDSNEVIVPNENNGSDGVAFVEHFKGWKLVAVISVPSWGGLVGILNGQTTIDNGTTKLSNNALLGRERTWCVENHGADPDTLVDNPPASAMAGRDAQLEKAIEVVLGRSRRARSNSRPGRLIQRSR